MVAIMRENDKKVIDKYNFSEAEAEEYIERVGIGIYDGGLEERKAAMMTINCILGRRNMMNHDD